MLQLQRISKFDHCLARRRVLGRLRGSARGRSWRFYSGRTRIWFCRGGFSSIELTLQICNSCVGSSIFADALLSLFVRCGWCSSGSSSGSGSSFAVSHGSTRWRVGGRKKSLSRRGLRVFADALLSLFVPGFLFPNAPNTIFSQAICAIAFVLSTIPSPLAFS